MIERERERERENEIERERDREREIERERERAREREREREKDLGVLFAICTIDSRIQEFKAHRSCHLFGYGNVAAWHAAYVQPVIGRFRFASANSGADPR